MDLGPFLLFALFLSPNTAQHSRGFFAPENQNFGRAEPFKNSFQQQYTPSNLIRNTGFAPSAQREKPFPSNFQSGLRFNNNNGHRNPFPSEKPRFPSPHSFRSHPQHVHPFQGASKRSNDPNNFVQSGGHQESQRQSPQPALLDPQRVVKTVPFNTHHQGFLKKEPPRNLPSGHQNGQKIPIQQPSGLKIKQLSKLQPNFNKEDKRPIQEEPPRSHASSSNQNDPREHLELDHHKDFSKEAPFQKSADSKGSQLKALEIVSFPSRSHGDKKSLEPPRVSPTSAFEVNKDEYKAFMDWVKKNRHLMRPGATTNPPTTMVPPTTSTTTLTTTTTPATTKTSTLFVPTKGMPVFRTIHLNASPATTTVTILPTTTTPKTTTKAPFRPKFRNIKRIRNFNAKFRPKPMKYFQRYRNQKMKKPKSIEDEAESSSPSTTVRPKYFVLNNSRRIRKWRPGEKDLSKLRIHKAREGQAGQREKVVQLLTSTERKPFQITRGNSSTNSSLDTLTRVSSNGNELSNTTTALPSTAVIEEVESPKEEESTIPFVESSSLLIFDDADDNFTLASSTPTESTLLDVIEVNNASVQIKKDATNSTTASLFLEHDSTAPLVSDEALIDFTPNDDATKESASPSKEDYSTTSRSSFLENGSDKELIDVTPDDEVGAFLEEVASTKSEEEPFEDYSTTTSSFLEDDSKAFFESNEALIDFTPENDEVATFLEKVASTKSEEETFEDYSTTTSSFLEDDSKTFFESDEALIDLTPENDEVATFLEDSYSTTTSSDERLSSFNSTASNLPPESNRRSDNDEFPDFLKHAITMSDSLNLAEVQVNINRTMNFSEGYARSVVYS